VRRAFDNNAPIRRISTELFWLCQLDLDSYMRTVQPFQGATAMVVNGGDDQTAIVRDLDTGTPTAAWHGDAAIEQQHGLRESASSSSATTWAPSMIPGSALS
jgi:hypothetical protein